MNEQNESRLIFWTSGPTTALLRAFTSEIGLSPLIAYSWEQLKQLTQDNSSENVVIYVENTLVEESIIGITRRLAEANPKIYIYFINYEDRSSQAFYRALTPWRQLKRNYETILISEPEKIITTLRNLAKRKTPPPESEKRLTAADELQLSDEASFAPNRIARLISKEFASLSASIHNDPRLLASRYVQMEDKTSSTPSQVSKETLKAWARYTETANNRETSLTPLPSVPPDRNACARFGEVLWLKNRFTYLLLGERGCGKTTFLNYLLKEYLPKAYPEKVFEVLFVDFLTYDFVTDAQTLAFKLQKQAFEQLTAGMNTSFGEFVSTNQSGPKALLWDRIPDDFEIDGITREFAISLLNSQDATAFNDLYDEIFPLNEDHQGTPWEKPEKTLWSFRNAIVYENNPKLICRLIACLATRSQIGREKLIADQILSQAAQRVHCKPYLLQAGFDPETLRPIHPAENSVEIARRFLRLKSRNFEIFVVIDNADRSIFPSVELEIFRTAWSFIPRGCSNFNMVFAMRTDTYNRHRIAISDFKNPVMLDDVRDYANIYSSTILKAPSFLEVAGLRIDGLIRDARSDGNFEAAQILEAYAKGILEAKGANEIFESLFEGDLRRSLELFEFALGSHHMEKTPAYLEAMQTRRRTSFRSTLQQVDYVQVHRLLSALMLGSWDRFRQERNIVFLNVYNAKIPGLPDTERWKNTLVLPRLIEYISSFGQPGEEISRIRKTFCDQLGYRPLEVQHGLGLLKTYRMLETIDSEGRGRYSRFDDSARVRLNNWGYYYCEGVQRKYTFGLMYRLEYVQTIYWDTPVPRRYFYKDFSTFMPVENLEAFVSCFQSFLAEDEYSEAQHLKKADLYESSQGYIFRLSDRVEKSCNLQLRNIYESKKDRV